MAALTGIGNAVHVAEGLDEPPVLAESTAGARSSFEQQPAEVVYGIMADADPRLDPERLNLAHNTYLPDQTTGMNLAQASQHFASIAGDYAQHQETVALRLFDEEFPAKSLGETNSAEFRKSLDKIAPYASYLPPEQRNLLEPHLRMAAFLANRR